MNFSESKKAGAPAEVWTMLSEVELRRAGRAEKS